MKYENDIAQLCVYISACRFLGQARCAEKVFLTLSKYSNFSHLKGEPQLSLQKKNLWERKVLSLDLESLFFGWFTYNIWLGYSWFQSDKFFEYVTYNQKAKKFAETIFQPRKISWQVCYSYKCNEYIHLENMIFVCI